jgi:hypothetical protein
MILISHRGNIYGKNIDEENKPSYIDYAIRKGFDVEVDVWVDENDDIFLGHDNPQYKVDIFWFGFRKNNLWIHCKNIQSIELFSNQVGFNYFWHDTDTMTLTSKGFIWAYPGKQPIRESISVLPELYNDDVSFGIGICSDFIQNYKERFSEGNL